MASRAWKQPRIEDAFFPVELRPTFTQFDDLHGGYTKLPRHHAVIDMERSNVLSVVSDDYKLVTNREAYAQAGDIMKLVFNVTTIDDLQFLNVQMPKSRSYCHIDLIQKGKKFSPFERDEWSAFIRITNSYNRTKRLQFQLGYCRWICLNGMIFGAKSVDVSYSHTHRDMKSRPVFDNRIGEINALERQMIARLQGLQRFHVSPQHMLPLACKTFGVSPPDLDVITERQAEALCRFRNRIRQLTEDYFAEMGHHGYAALNVLTDYASYPEHGVSPEDLRHGFQQAASAWMDDFTVAIEKRDFRFEHYLGASVASATVLDRL